MYPGFNEAGLPNLTHCACDKRIPPFSHTLVCKCNLISGFTLAACLSGRGMASGNWMAWVQGRVGWDETSVVAPHAVTHSD